LTSDLEKRREKQSLQNPCLVWLQTPFLYGRPYPERENKNEEGNDSKGNIVTEIEQIPDPILEEIRK